MTLHNFGFLLLCSSLLPAFMLLGLGVLHWVGKYDKKYDRTLDGYFAVMFWYHGRNDLFGIISAYNLWYSFCFVSLLSARHLEIG